LANGFSIPFFFEPNFDARVSPLAAAVRLQADESNAPDLKDPVVYGEFLMRKVGNNFASGKGKYD
jgi:isopenicillin N synthase-like dioxygenase